MKVLQPGGNLALNQVGISDKIFIGLKWISKNGQYIDIDASAFLLNENDSVNCDDDFIFYNQHENKNQSVIFDSTPENGIDIKRFFVDLKKLPKNVNRISFVLTIDSAIEKGQDFSQVNGLSIRVFEQDNIILFEPNCFTKETAVIMGDIYLHQSNWKFRAIGQGFYSGLAELAKSYGVEIESEQEENAPNLENKGRYNKKALNENELKIKKRLCKIVPKIKQAVKQNLNESNTRSILDRVFTDVLGYRLGDIKNEVRIAGRKADYVLTVDGTEKIVVEAKKAGLPLKNEQIFQATSYAAYSGIPYVLLTNLSEFLLFKVKTDGVVDYDIIFSIDFMQQLEQKDINNLALISKHGVANQEKELEALCSQMNVTALDNIARLLTSNEVVDAIKNLIKKEQNVDVSDEQVFDSIELILISAGAISPE